MSTIADNLGLVRRRIEAAAERARRDPSEIRLLAVSKKKPVAAIRAAYAAGQRDFGENYVSELDEKANALIDLEGIRFHMIGHLQSNKARRVAAVAAMVHTIDSIRLAERLGRIAAEDRPAEAKRLGALVEVNVGQEDQKSGCRPDAVEPILAAIEAAPALELRGLMAVPPRTDDPSGAHRYFDALRELAEQHGGRARLPDLSMGMSDDLEVAILAGATWVRVGTAIFGAREG